MAATKILILAANPKDTSPIRLDEEVREIRESLRLAKQRDYFELHSVHAVRIKDLRRSLLEFEPKIVHFSGHGTGADGLALEDETGKSKLVTASSLAGLFELFPDVECVVLNACYSVVQADAIAQHVGHVVGMTQAIGDEAAKQFSMGFYDGLGSGRGYAQAFKFGRSAIDLEGLTDGAVPKLITQASEPSSEPASNAAPEPPKAAAPAKKAKIFISYKRDGEADEALALQLVESLGANHEVFIDQQMPVGTRWREQIERQIRQSDAVIVLLSGRSVQSEMVELEVGLAQEAAAASGEGRPQILPVRVQYREPFQYPLDMHLDPINWAFWDGPEDTARLVAELEVALAGGALPVATAQAKEALLEEWEESPANQKLPPPKASAQPRRKKKKRQSQPLEQPEGTMDPESAFYVAREQIDSVALETIAQLGVTLTIKGPRQMGKSSLLLRTVEAARAAGKQVVFLDFQLFDQAALQDADQFYRQFCYCLADELDLEDAVEHYWARPLGNTQRCTRYVERHVLKQVTEPIVLAMDEVERMFDTPFRNDFFSMLRSWHNQRAMKPLWKRLDLALVTSTEPYQLIADLNQSPFNVGQVLRLEDFTPAQVGALNEAHGEPFGAGELQKLIGLLNGHPYLTRRALYLVASGRLEARELFSTAADERGPFGDHLRYHLFRMYDQQALVKGFLEVLRRRNCADERIFFRLNGAGVVMREGHNVVPRCQLYGEFFGEHLRG